MVKDAIDRVTQEKFAIEPSELVEVMDEFSKLLKKIERYNPHVDKDLIKRALRFAAVAHAGQRRHSGSPFIYHGIQTASILADIHLDSVMIACGILHDVVEDTNVTIDEVRREFGDEITEIIAGLTNIAGLELKSPEERQADIFRKMILYTAKDVRTIIVKFADRLHNMRTLRFLPAEKRRQVAHETLEVFAPLAHRFGINTIKTELEERAFRWLYPLEYREVKAAVKHVVEIREDYFNNFIEPIKQHLTEEGIEHVIQWRLKHLYSIYRKMTYESKNIRDIYDIYAVRIIVNTIPECYNTLGIVHSLFTPVVERIKDFIATPKFNMYQSLHTTIIGPEGRMVEIQIRTHEMHQTAETGIAAHWRYKEGKVKPDEIDAYMSWVRRMVEWQKSTPEPSEFMRELKMDLFEDEIFVFTPKGDLIQLPTGATPIDFAFALHTEIGLHCSGARVNGRIVPLNTKLRSGEWVEIVTNSNKNPTPGWLSIVKTAKARSIIRRWIKRQHFNESRNLGIDMMSKIEKQAGRKLTDKDRTILIRKYRQREWDQFLGNLGIGDISLNSVRNHFGLMDKKKQEQESIAVKAPIGVSIQGIENLLVSFAHCCKPLPGDEIVGFITRGRGLIIHRTNCENIRTSGQDIDRSIHVDWKPSEDMVFVASIRVEALDRKSLLNDITSAIAKSNCNIRTAAVTTNDDLAIGDFDIDVKDLDGLKKLMNEIRKIKGISRVSRLDKRSPENVPPANE